MSISTQKTSRIGYILTSCFCILHSGCTIKSLINKGNPECRGFECRTLLHSMQTIDLQGFSSKIRLHCRPLYLRYSKGNTTRLRCGVTTRACMLGGGGR